MAPGAPDLGRADRQHPVHGPDRAQCVAPGEHPGRTRGASEPRNRPTHDRRRRRVGADLRRRRRTRGDGPDRQRAGQRHAGLDGIQAGLPERHLAREVRGRDGHPLGRRGPLSFAATVALVWALYGGVPALPIVVLAIGMGLAIALYVAVTLAASTIVPNQAAAAAIGLGAISCHSSWGSSCQRSFCRRRSSSGRSSRGSASRPTLPRWCRGARP